jgi:hypothetical protein
MEATFIEKPEENVATLAPMHLAILRSNIIESR